MRRLFRNGPLSFADPSADPDGDNRTNDAESLSRTDPLDPDSRLRVSSLTRDPSTGLFTVDWRAVEDVVYRIVATSDLTIWNPNQPEAQVLSDPLELDGEADDILSFVVALPPGMNFLRAEVIENDS